MSLRDTQTLQPALISRTHGTKCLFEAFWAGRPPQWAQMVCPKPMLLSPGALLLPPSRLVFTFGYILVPVMFCPQPACAHALFLWVFSPSSLSPATIDLPVTAEFSSLTPTPFSDPQGSSLSSLWLNWRYSHCSVSGPSASVNCCYCSKPRWV